MYSSQLREYFLKDTYVGEFAQALNPVITVRSGMVKQSDICQIQFHLDEQNQMIRDGRYQVLGAPALVASAAYAIESSIGQSVNILNQQCVEDYIAALQLSQTQIGAAARVIQLLRASYDNILQGSK